MPGYDDLYGDDDDMGADEFGATERRITNLIARKSKLEALLPVVRPARRKAIVARLQHIDRVLEKSGYSAEQAAIADAIAASGAEGVGGMEFQVNAPPGLGRLVRLPFYPTEANANTVTSGGTGVASTTNPLFIEDLVAAAGFTTGGGAHLLQTPAVSWAVLRIVGFESQIRKQTSSYVTQAGPLLLVSDLQIGGGANLFTHEDFADAKIYDADQPEFCGLRDYPILKSPNVAEVTVQVVTNLDIFGAPTVAIQQNLTCACALLCEVLVDDNYGAHIPGPYARKGALVRQNGSFV